MFPSLTVAQPLALSQAVKWSAEVEANVKERLLNKFGLSVLARTVKEIQDKVCFPLLTRGDQSRARVTLRNACVCEREEGHLWCLLLV